MQNDDRLTADLQRHVDDGWTDAQGNAEVLADEIEQLCWDERATQVDWFLWQLGARLVDEDSAEAVIERRRATIVTERSILSYVETAEQTLAAILLRLDANAQRVESDHQCVVYALSPLAVHRAAAEAWIEEHGLDGVAEALHCLPGFAFLSMARSVDDTALTLLARDALWTAMVDH
ncbi:MAG: hypothetical protein AAFX81_19090 [Pseudomonadota bacterium]